METLRRRLILWEDQAAQRMERWRAEGRVRLGRGQTDFVSTVKEPDRHKDTVAGKKNPNVTTVLKMISSVLANDKLRVYLYPFWISHTVKISSCDRKS